MWGAARVRPGCGRARGTRARVTFVLLPTASAGLGLRGAAAPAARRHRPLRRVTCQCLSHVLVTVAVTVGGVTVVVVGLPASATPCSQTHPKSPRGCTRPRERGRRHHPSIGYGPHRSYGAPRPSSGGSQKVTLLKWLCREKSDFGTRGELEPMRTPPRKSHPLPIPRTWLELSSLTTLAGLSETSCVSHVCTIPIPHVKAWGAGDSN